MEPDHSGAITAARAMFPGIKLVGNKKTIEFVNQFYGDPGDTVIVGDGDTLALGRHTLSFALTPMVHWPETMVTYDPTDKVLFSGDAFGGFGTLHGGIFDDEVDLANYENEILRYFSNIVGKYSPMVQKAIAKLAGLDIRIICATHGPIFRGNPGYIIDKYDKWSRYEAEKGVVVVYASMYRNTQKMAEQVARSLAENKIDVVKMHNISHTHISYIITDIWRYKGAVLGSCTYNTRLFPLMDLLVCSLDAKMMQHREVGLFGSFTWSGGALKDLKAFAEKGKWDVVEPMVEAKSCPSDQDLIACADLGRNVAAQTLASFE
jgi:flavorubredoxin